LGACATTHDERKRANLKKHSHDFADARGSSKATAPAFEDRRFEYDEQRFVTLGVLRGEVVVIVTTETDEENP
jgi:hypothetical protein